MTGPTRWLAILAVVCCTFPLLAGDWPQWRGPSRSGIAEEKGLLKSWPKEGPKLLWSTTGIGGGYSCPAIVGDRLYVMGSKGEEEFVFALSRKDGKPLWERKIGKVGENLGPQYPGPRATPTIDGERLYTLGSDGDLVCLECASGKLVWQHHLERSFEGGRNAWAYCESPLIDGDRLICTPGGPSAAMLALEKKTGKVVWKTAMEDGNVAGYASATIAYAGKRKLYVQFMGAAVVGVDAQTGKQLFRYRKNVGGVNCAMPIYHDGHVFTTSSGHEGAGGDALLRLVPTDKGVEAREVYLLRNLMNFHGGVIRIGAHLYGTGHNGLVCLDFKTGAVQWRHRSIGRGSLLVADGHLYLRGERGEMALVEATPEGYREKGRFNQPKRSKYPTFTHPALANGQLYLRDADLLFCYDVRDTAPPTK